MSFRSFVAAFDATIRALLHVFRAAEKGGVSGRGTVHDEWEYCRVPHKQ
jgi:hypothetical protein